MSLSKPSNVLLVSVKNHPEITMKATITPTAKPGRLLPKTIQSMKTSLTMLKSLLLLCGVFAATAAVGQTVRVWDGGDGTGTNLGAATNWVGDVLPATTSGTLGDFATWDNLVTGNLLLTYNGGIAGGFQSSGANFILTPNQVG
jgi:hypothetical protein